MTRYTDLLFQFFFYLDIISAHNILRLEDTRLAKFILRHTDKVHVTSHYKEFYTQEEAACVDRCVTETECKSVNFYKDETDLEKSKCQLVDEDIDDQNEYVTRAGWRHLDTGRVAYETNSRRYLISKEVSKIDGRSMQVEHRTHLLTFGF